jgi:hypothetical protein
MQSRQSRRVTRSLAPLLSPGKSCLPVSIAIPAAALDAQKQVFADTINAITAASASTASKDFLHDARNVCFLAAQHWMAARPSMSAYRWQIQQ